MTNSEWRSQEYFCGDGDTTTNIGGDYGDRNEPTF